VNVWVTERMARDLDAAAEMLGTDKSKLVREAIGKLLSEYRHLLDR
jgi:metal-responsive CopG/Arc/MetJ family transcriptional regulator